MARNKTRDGILKQLDVEIELLEREKAEAARRGDYAEALISRGAVWATQAARIIVSNAFAAEGKKRGR